MNKIRTKFIMIAMAVMIVTTAILVFAINMVNYKMVDQEVMTILTNIAANDGQFPMHKPFLEPMGNEVSSATDNKQSVDALEIPNTDDTSNESAFLFPRRDFAAEAAYETRYFTVHYIDDSVQDVNLKNIASVDHETALEMADQVLATGKTQGFLGNFRYLVSLNKDDGKTTIVFVDCESRMDAMQTLAIVSIIIALIGIAIMFLAVSLFSKRAIAPVVESALKQKQFITDASHELKTPLTVISANMDILSMDLGENEWVEGTKKQVSSLRRMVNQMVSLTRMEEERPLVRVPFNVSEAVSETSDPFAAMCDFEGGKFLREIEPNVTYQGDEQAIRGLVTILCDNAVKYASKQDAQIELRLKKHGRKLMLEVSNGCDEMIPEDVLSRLFDRFYRADASRSKNLGRSGYGIGLAIAKATVDRHGGRISVRQEADRRIIFQVIL